VVAIILYWGTAFELKEGLSHGDVVAIMLYLGTAFEWNDNQKPSLHALSWRIWETGRKRV